MAIQEETYKGKKIVINTEGNEIHLTIDGENIPVWYDSISSRYIATQHSPYISHASLLDLAKHVIDYVITQRA